MKPMSKLLSAATVICALTILTAPAFAAGTTYAVDTLHTQVVFSFNHDGFSSPSFIIYPSEGTLTWDAKDLDNSAISITFPVSGIHTPLPVLNHRFKKKFFEIDKYPDITFNSSKVKRVGYSNYYIVTGNLTVHGVTKEITFKARLTNEAEDPLMKAPAIGFVGTTTLNRSDFGMDQYEPIVSDLVTVRLNVEALEPEANKKMMAGVEKFRQKLKQ